MSIDISTLTPKVATDAYGCPHPLLVRKLAESLQTFCRRSYVWRYFSQLYFTPSEDLYDIDIPADTQLVDILKVHTDNYILVPDISEISGVDDDNASKPTGTPVAYIRIPPNQIKFTPTPVSVYPVNIQCVLAPTGNIVPDWIIDAYGSAIIAGAKWLLLSIPETPWYRIKLAAYHQNEFRKALNSARASNIQSNRVQPFERI